MSLFNPPILPPPVAAGKEKEYIAEMEAKEEAALKTPIMKGMSFDIPHENATLQHSNPSPARQLPSWFGQHENHRVTLIKQLRSYNDRPSEFTSAVWAGSLLPVSTIPSHTSSDPSHYQEIRVFIKFTQPSQLASGTMPVPKPNPDRAARTDAALYDILRELQGSCIPYFFGKQKVRIGVPYLEI